VELGEGRRADQRPRAKRDEEQQHAMDLQQVAGTERGLVALLTVDVRGVSTDPLHLDRRARRAEREVACGDAGAGEDLLVRVDGGRHARTVLEEVHEPGEIAVAASEEERLVVGERGDLADAVGLGEGPDDDEDGGSGGR
jgi:hypothetical protein